MMTNSYDLTPDDRGLKLGRLVDIDLVIVRNRAYAIAMTKHNSVSDDGILSIANNYDAIELYELSQQLLES